MRLVIVINSFHMENQGRKLTYLKGCHEFNFGRNLCRSYISNLIVTSSANSNGNNRNEIKHGEQSDIS